MSIWAARGYAHYQDGSMSVWAVKGHAHHQDESISNTNFTPKGMTIKMKHQHSIGATHLGHQKA